MSILTTADRFRRELDRAIHERVLTYSEHLASGVADDFSEYARRVGRIAGLREALELMNEAERRMTVGEGEENR